MLLSQQQKIGEDKKLSIIGRSRSLTTNRPTSIRPGFLTKPSFLPAAKGCNLGGWLELDLYNDGLFGGSWKLKDKDKNTKFRLKFEGCESAKLTRKDKNDIVASLNILNITSQRFTITLSSTKNEVNKLHTRTRSFGNNHYIELHFPNPYQTEYLLKIGDREFLWQPLMVNSDWVLVPVLHYIAEDPPTPLARFKRKVLNPSLGQLTFHCSFSQDDISILTLSLGYILYRHIKKPYAH